MEKLPITFDEKVDARFQRTPGCWIWDGSLLHGRPALNLKHVTRYIYERERGPIPEGMTLWRTDHWEGCQRGRRCRHQRCVNPWHVELKPLPMGTYPRDVEWSETGTDRVNEYKRRSRRTPTSRSSDVNNGDSQDFHEQADG